MTPDIRSVPQKTSRLEAAVLEQWNATHGTAYALRDHVLHWNFSKQNLISYSFHQIAGTPVITAIATQVGIAAGIPARNVWLSLWGQISDYEKFVSELKAFTKSAGKKKTVIGGDEFHLVPGVPLTEAGEKLKTALQAANFSGAEAADYFGDINSPAVEEYIAHAKAEYSERGLSFVSVTTPEQISTAEKFLAKEFPGRWTREFKFWSSREDTQRAYWKLLQTKDGEVIGFARMAVRGRSLPLERNWTPAALRMPTQLEQPRYISNTDCCLGPIGVASTQRGKGTGKVLLGLVLESLRNSPGERICIDWTDAFKYYEPLKFEVARRYWTTWFMEE